MLFLLQVLWYLWPAWKPFFTGFRLQPGNQNIGETIWFLALKKTLKCCLLVFAFYLIFFVSVETRNITHLWMVFLYVLSWRAFTVFSKNRRFWKSLFISLSVFIAESNWIYLKFLVTVYILARWCVHIGRERFWERKQPVSSTNLFITKSLPRLCSDSSLPIFCPFVKGVLPYLYLGKGIEQKRTLYKQKLKTDS